MIINYKKVCNYNGYTIAKRGECTQYLQVSV